MRTTESIWILSPLQQSSQDGVAELFSTDTKWIDYNYTTLRLSHTNIVRYLLHFVLSLLCICLLQSRSLAQDVRSYEDINARRSEGTEAWTPISQLVVDDDESVTILHYATGTDRVRNLVHDTVIMDESGRQTQSLFVSHYDKNDKLMWSVRLGILGYPRYQMNAFIHRLRSGEYLLALSFMQTIVIGRDTLSLEMIDGYPAFGIVCVMLSAHGEIKSHRLLASSVQLELNAMTLDANEKVYLAGRFGQFQCDWQTTILHNPESPAYFLAAVNVNGELQYAKATRTGWKDASTIVSMQLDPIRKHLHLIFSKGTVSTFSTCANDSWSLNHQVWTLDGVQLSNDTIATSDDLLIGTNATIDPAGNLNVLVLYRGHLHCGEFAFSSHPGTSPEACAIPNSALIRLDPIGKVIAAYNFIQDHYQALHQLIVTPDFHMILGGQSHYLNSETTWRGWPYPHDNDRTELLGMNYFGELLWTRQFSKRRQTGEVNYDYLRIVQVKSSELVVADDHVGYYDTLAIQRDVDDFMGADISLFRFRMQNEESGPSAMNAWLVRLLAPDQSTIQIITNQSQANDYQYEVYDALSRCLSRSSEAIDQLAKNIDVSHFFSGAYFLHLHSASQSQVVPFVVNR